MRIEKYNFGKIIIDGKEHDNDVIISRKGVDSWWREEGHNVAVADVEDVVSREPDIIVVGTGHEGRMNVPEETKDYIKKKGIKLVVEKTKEAVKAFNDAEEENKVAMLHLTC